MPWITTAPISSGRFAKQSWIARMMPSFSALRLAGRLRPTVSTAPDVSILSGAARSAVTAAAAFPIYCVLRRIVILYNHWWGSQSETSSRRTCLGKALVGHLTVQPKGQGCGVRRDDDAGFYCRYST